MKGLIGVALLAFIFLAAGCASDVLDSKLTPLNDPNAGDYHLAGDVKDSAGQPLDGVKITSKCVRRYWVQRSDKPGEWFTGTDQDVKTFDGSFSIDEENALTVTLLFEKDGFTPRTVNFSTDSEHGLSVVHNNLHVVLRPT